MAQIIDLGKFRFNWMGDYEPLVEYERNDTVKYGGNVYVYTLNAASTGNLPTDTDFWALMLEGFNFRGDWATGTAYELSDLVTYGGKVYLALQDTIGNNPATSGIYWEVFVDGIQYEGEWAAITNYQVGDVVKYGGVVYIATQNSVSATPTGSSAYWEILVYGLEYKGTYNDATSYKLNDIVLYGGTSYIALQPGVGNEPVAGAYWGVFTEGFQFEGEWDDATPYQTGDVVNYGGIVYVALADSTGSTPDTPEDWSILIEGIAWKGTYSAGTTYNKNDIVSYGGSSWIAKQNTLGNAPVAGVYWDTLAQGTFPSFAGHNYQFLSNNGSTLQWVPDVTVDTLTANVNEYVGPGAAAFETSAGLTNALAVYKYNDGIEANSFAQIAFTNADATSSSDFQIFMDNGTDDSGWIDMGIAGSAFNDPSYAITYAGDGYLFVKGKPTYSGNLVFGTGNSGTNNKIIFAAGGYDSGNTQMTITPDQSVKINIPTPSTSPTTGALQVVGGVGISGNVNVAGNVAIVGTISFGGSGTTVSTANLAVDAPIIFSGTGNTNDTIDLGLVSEYTITAASPATKAVSNKALTSNIATLTTTTSHGFTVGQVVQVTGVDSTFNGTWTITGTPTATTFTYTKEATNVSSTAVSPTGTATTTRDRRYSGIARNYSDGVYKFFSNATTKPSTTVNFSDSGLVYAPIKTGAATVNSLTVAASGSITATASGVTSAIQNLTLSGSTNSFGGTIAGDATFSGNPTFSGTPVFSGNPSFTGVPSFTGGVRVQEMVEDVVDVAHVSNVIGMDYSVGNNFFLSNTPSANMTINVTNAPTTAGRVFTLNLLVTQGSTGYVPTTLNINGGATTLKWNAGVTPSPTSSAGKIDIFTFTVVYRASAFTVLVSSNLNY
jgi:hypothetical protein